MRLNLHQKSTRVVMHILLICVVDVLFTNSALAGAFIRDTYGVWEEGAEYVGIDPWRAVGENRSPKSDHPYLIDARNMKLLLQALETTGRNGELEPLLTDQQARDFGNKLSKAFAIAYKKTDVIFAIENEAANGEMVVGRMFYDDGKINLILGGRKSGSKPGVRARAASDVYKLDAAAGITYLNSDRYDWVQFLPETVLLESWERESGQERKSEIESLQLEVKDLQKQLANKEPLLSHDVLPSPLNYVECPLQFITGVEAETRIKRLQYLFNQDLITDAELKALRIKVLNEI